MPRLLYIIPETNFNSQHEGLITQMKERGIDFAKLKPGDIVGFLNRRETMFRMLTVLPEKETWGLVSSYRAPSGRVPETVMEMIAKAFASAGISMDPKVKMGLAKLLGKRRLEIVRADAA